MFLVELLFPVADVYLNWPSSECPLLADSRHSCTAHSREVSERIETMIRSPVSSSVFSQLYAVQQALSWALEPTDFKLPTETIISSGVQPFTGIPEGSEDYSASPHLPQS